MKKIFIPILVLCLVTFEGFTQVKIQGTITDPSPGGNKVRVYGKNNSNTALTNVLFGNINITFSIVDQGAGNPTEAQITKTSLIPSLDLLPTNPSNPYIISGRAYYSYLMNNIAVVTTTSTFPANSNNNPIAEFTFPANTYFPGMRLDDVSPTGGPNGQMFWYVQVNGLGDITDYATMFFGDPALPPTNNASASPSFVPLQLFSLLPVKFSNFTVTKNNNSAILNWSAENEDRNLEMYEIQRSFDGINFKKVNVVEPKNNGKSSNSYDMTDLNVTTALSSGIIYYRIKQIDKDGRFILSGIKNIRVAVKGLAVNVYPNPIRSYANLIIDLEQDATVTITINDISGKQLQNFQTMLFKGTNNKKINMENLAAGSYMLKVQTPAEIKTITLVKAN